MDAGEDNSKVSLMVRSAGATVVKKDGSMMLIATGRKGVLIFTLYFILGAASTVFCKTDAAG